MDALATSIAGLSGLSLFFVIFFVLLIIILNGMFLQYFINFWAEYFNKKPGKLDLFLATIIAFFLAQITVPLALLTLAYSIAIGGLPKKHICSCEQKE